MTIKPLSKPTKKRTQTKKYWRNKADRKLQEIAREMYADKGCLICGQEYSCVHHFINKARSTHLRYNWKNLIPICARHHQCHHSGDSRVHGEIIKIKGVEWLTDLLLEEKAGQGINAGYVYYREIFNKLNKNL